MNEYTPTTEEVRHAYGNSAVDRRPFTETPVRPEAEEEFDRWFASEIEKAERRGAFRGARALLDANFKWDEQWITWDEWGWSEILSIEVDGKVFLTDPGKQD